MRIVVRRFEDGDREGVHRLNERLEKGGTAHRIYEEDPTLDAEASDRPHQDSLYVAVDEAEGEVRGGTWLREQHFRVGGEEHPMGWLKYPVAESLVDPAYAGVPASMILQLLRRQPRLMAAGMGGHDAPIARLLAGIRWKASSVPFLFRIVRPFRVLRGLEYARRKNWMRTAMDGAAWSGLGWLGHRVATMPAAIRSARSGHAVTLAHRFGPWADGIWERSRDEYHALAVRDARALDDVYPPTLTRTSRLRVSRGGSDVGWALTQFLPRTQDAEHYFGALRVGAITDALARPEDATAVLAASVDRLSDEGADMVVASWSHRAWIKSARGLGFLPGPSTFAFYRSPGAAELLDGGGEEAESCHFMRTDGHGPEIDRSLP